MATFRKRGASWEVQVCRRGIRQTATFRTKGEAAAWAAKLESEILAGSRGQIPDKPFSALLERYRDEISVTKRGEKWERTRIGLLLRDELAQVRLPALNPTHFAAWRDRRLRAVSPASVLREWNLLSHAASVAVKEWHWLKENPLLEIRKPKSPLPRDRRISDTEIARLLLALGYTPSSSPDTATARVGAAFLFAIETGMRAGEIVSLRWDWIDGSVARLPITKNGFPRAVPLSPEAVRILNQLPKLSDAVFALNSGQIDALFRKAKARALVEDLHFHDTRHEAITRLAKRLDVLDLARMVGIRDLRILMVYYNPRAEEIANRLAAPPSAGSPPTRPSKRPVGGLPAEGGGTCL